METKGDSGRSPEAAPATTIESTPSTIATSGSPALDHIEKRRQKKRMLKECLTRPAIVPLLRLEDDDDLGVKWMLALVPRNGSASSEQNVKRSKEKRNAGDTLKRVEDTLPSAQKAAPPPLSDIANCDASGSMMRQQLTSKDCFQPISSSVNVSSLFRRYLSRPLPNDNEDSLVYDVEEDFSEVNPIQWTGPEPYRSLEEVPSSSNHGNYSRPASPASSTGFEPQYISSDEEGMDMVRPMDNAPRYAAKVRYGVKKEKEAPPLITISDDSDDDSALTIGNAPTPPAPEFKPRAVVSPFRSSSVTHLSNKFNDSGMILVADTSATSPLSSAPNRMESEAQQSCTPKRKDTETQQSCSPKRNNAETRLPVVERCDGDKRAPHPPTLLERLLVESDENGPGTSAGSSTCVGKYVPAVNTVASQPQPSVQSPVPLKPMAKKTIHRSVSQGEGPRSFLRLISLSIAVAAVETITTASEIGLPPSADTFRGSRLARKRIHSSTADASSDCLTRFTPQRQTSSTSLPSSSTSSPQAEILSSPSRAKSLRRIESELATICVSPRRRIMPELSSPRRSVDSAANVRITSPSKPKQSLARASRICPISPSRLIEAFPLKRRISRDERLCPNGHQGGPGTSMKPKSSMQMKAQKLLKRCEATRRSKSPSSQEKTTTPGLSSQKSRPFQSPKKTPIVGAGSEQQQQQQQQDQSSIVSPLDVILSAPLNKVAMEGYHSTAKPIEKRPTLPVIGQANRMLKTGTAMLANKNKSPIGPSAPSASYSLTLKTAVGGGLLADSGRSMSVSSQMASPPVMHASSSPPSVSSTPTSPLPQSSSLQLSPFPAAQSASTPSASQIQQDPQGRIRSILKPSDRGQSHSGMQPKAVEQGEVPMDISFDEPVGEQLRKKSESKQVRFRDALHSLAGYSLGLADVRLFNVVDPVNMHCVHDQLVSPASTSLDGLLHSPPRSHHRKHTVDQSVVDEFINDILRWNPSWLTERKLNNAVPELCDGFTKHVPTTFDRPIVYSSLGDYIASMKPRFMLKLWKSLCDDIDLRATKRADRFSRCALEGEREARGDFAAIKLRLLLAVEAFECQWQQAPIDMLVELNCTTSSGQTTVLCFGLIMHQETNPATGVTSPSCYLTLDLRVSSKQAQMFDAYQQIYIRPLLQLRPYVALIYGYASMQNSKLSPAFLKPAERVMATQVPRDVILHSSNARHLCIQSQQKLYAVVNDCFEKPYVPRLHFCATVSNMAERNSKIAILVEELIRRKRQCNTNKTGQSTHGAILVLFSGSKEVGERYYRALEELKQKFSEEHVNDGFLLLRLRNIESEAKKRAKKIANEKYLTDRIVGLERQIKTYKNQKGSIVLGVQEECNQKVLKKQKLEEVLTKVRNGMSSQDWTAYCVEQKAELIKSADVIFASVYECAFFDQCSDKTPLLASIVLNGSDIAEFELSPILKLSVDKVFLFGDVLKKTQRENGQNSTLFERFVATFSEKNPGMTLQAAVNYFE